MAWSDKVVWQEGMFLRAQHFQQQDRHFEARLEARAAPLRAHPWGLTELALDRDLLAAGKFAVASMAGVMPDGTPFAVPGTADQPAPIELREGAARNQVVFLALPVRQDGNFEVAAEAAEAAADPALARRARYGLRAFAADDTHSGATLPAELAVGRPRLRLMLEGEDRAGFACLGLARIVEVQADRRVQTDERFVPPCLRSAASPALQSFVEELEGMLRQRAEAIAARLGQPGARGAADVADFLLLMAVNRALPVVAHAAQGGHLHPEELFRLLAALAGELATFAAEDKRAAEYPPYRHDDLQRSFAPVVADLRRFLTYEGGPRAVAIPLQERSYGVRVGPILDRGLLRDARFVLAVAADMPEEQLRRAFPAQVKIGAVERISELVRVAVPGVAVSALPVAPREVPFHAGSAYFGLDRGSPHWEALRTSAAIAIHVSGDFPNLRLALWAIRG